MDMLRSNVNKHVRIHERIVFPRIQDMLDDTVAVLRAALAETSGVPSGEVVIYHGSRVLLDTGASLLAAPCLRLLYTVQSKQYSEYNVNSTK